jgi:uncharacterized protein (TIRG00374 family)
MTFRRFLLGALLGAVLLYLFFRNMDLGEVWRIIRSGNAYWLTFAVAMNIFNYFMRSVRWRYFFVPIKKIGIWNSFETTTIGFAVSSVFPARVGEVVRPYLLGNKEQINKSAAFATIVVERVFDSITILFMFVVYLFVLMEPGTLGKDAQTSIAELKDAGLLVFAGLCVVVGLLYFVKTRPDGFQRIVQKLERLLPARMAHSLDGIVHSFVEGLSILHDPGLLLRIGFWSLLFWGVICLSFWAGVRAYLPAFRFTSVFLIMILLAIGISVPTPGGVGSYHLACQIGLSRFFAVPADQARAIAIISHFIGFVPVLILGILFIWHEGLSARQISRIVEEEKASQVTGDKNEA